MDTTKELGTKEWAAAVLLASGYSKAEVARRVGVSRRTLYYWLERPTFRATVDRVALEQAEEAKARLGRKSFAVLEQALDADEVLPTRYSDKLSAARTALQVAGLAGPQAGQIQITRSAVLFYGPRPERLSPETDYVPITDEEIDAADRELRAVEEALLGEGAAGGAAPRLALPEGGADPTDAGPER